MSKRGTQQPSRDAIDNVLDDLLGSDSDDLSKRKTSKLTSNKEKSSTSQKVKLSSNTSDSEFYKNLRSIGGEQFGGGYSEDEELSESALQKVAADIGDLDDLDNELFAGLGGTGLKKEISKTPPASKTKSSPKKNVSVHQLDDPLEGLGLSDEDKQKRTSTKKTIPPRRTLSRRLSKEKKKMEPSLFGNKLQDDHNSPSTDLGTDSFITKRPSPGRMNSFEEPSGSEEMSPHLSQAKHQSRHKSHKKPSIERTVDDRNDVIPQQKTEMQKSKSKIVNDDLFGDDDLPGFSDEDESHTKQQTSLKKSVITDEDISTEPASAALTNLLGGAKNQFNTRVKESTMLDKIMSGKMTKEEKSSQDLNEDLTFGAYTPSYGVTAGHRPTTAPTSRSVRFADDLGFKLDDSGERPASPPEKKTVSSSQKKVTPTEIETGSSRGGMTVQLSGSKQTSLSEQITDVKRTEYMGKDDWLGLGDDLTDELGLTGSSDLFSPRRNPKHMKETTAFAGDFEGHDKDANLVLPWEKTLKEQNSTYRRSKNSSDENKNQRKVDVNNNESLANNTKDVVKVKLDSKNLEDTSNNTRISAVDHSDKQAEEDFLSLLTKKKKTKGKDNSLTSTSTVSLSQVSLQHSNVSDIQLEVLQRQLPDSIPIQMSDEMAETSIPVLQQEQQLLQIQKLQKQLQDHLQKQEAVHVTPRLTDIELIKASLLNDLKQQQQNEFNATKRQFERDKSYLENELRELQQKVLKSEEFKSSSHMDYAARIRELEGSVKKLELERDLLFSSQETAKKRHQDEVKALEISHKTRMGFLEDSYKRREEQLKDEAEMTRVHTEEKIRGLLQEKNDAINNFRKKIEMIEKNKSHEVERLKELHKNSINDLVHEHSEQFNHLKALKEQEVAAAINAFSHTKSLQSLIAEVHNSTREVSSLQNKLDTSHHKKLNDWEQSLKARDEYLKKLEVRLHQQEIQNDAERERLQGLISKLEVQLREQSRQIEQDKWKFSQDENRLQAMQAAFDEDRRITTDHLMKERQQLTRAREDMLVEQKAIITECYEERRKIAHERSQLTVLQSEVINKSKDDRSSALQAESDLEATMLRFQHESSSFTVRLAQVKQQEEQLRKDKEESVTDQKRLKAEYDKLHEAAERLDKRSREIEQFSVESQRVHEEGKKALMEAHTLKAGYVETQKQLDNRLFALVAQEKAMDREKQKLPVELQRFDDVKRKNLCAECNKYRNCQLVGPCVEDIPFINSPYRTPLKGVNVIKSIDDSGHTPIIHQTSSPAKHASIVSPVTSPNSIQNNRTNPQVNAVGVTKTQERGRHERATKANKSLDFTMDSLQTGANRTNLDTTYDIAYSPSYDISYPPPDLLANNFEFDRAVRRWSSAREKDDEFFEEETKYLKKLQQKRIATL